MDYDRQSVMATYAIVGCLAAAKGETVIGAIMLAISALLWIGRH